MEITLDTQIEELEDKIAPAPVLLQVPLCIEVTTGGGAVLLEACDDGDGVPPPRITLNGNLVGRPFTLNGNLVGRP